VAAWAASASNIKVATNICTLGWFIAAPLSAAQFQQLRELRE
jgi:hypothetical protein